MKFSDLPHGNSALAIFPSVDGFGWIVFDGPLSPVDFGVCYLAKRARGMEQKNARCLARAEALLRQFRPAALVLEAFQGPGTTRHARISNLCRSLISAGIVSGATIRILSRKDISASFASQPADTRYRVATIVASYLPEIERFLQHKRKAWESEFPNAALFAAAALLIVHYANPREVLN